MNRGYLGPGQFPGPPPSGIVMHFQGSSFTYVVLPTFRINGQQVPAGSGERFYPAAPGRYHLDVHMQWTATYGQAGCDVIVYPGQPTHVWYGPPAFMWQRGNIGFVKQQRPGQVVSWVIAPFIVLSAIAWPFFLMS